MAVSLYPSFTGSAISTFALSPILSSPIKTRLRKSQSRHFSLLAPALKLRSTSTRRPCTICCFKNNNPEESVQKVWFMLLIFLGKSSAIYFSCSFLSIDDEFSLSLEVSCSVLLSFLGLLVGRMSWFRIIDICIWLWLFMRFESNERVWGSDFEVCGSSWTLSEVRLLVGTIQYAYFFSQVIAEHLKSFVHSTGSLMWLLTRNLSCIFFLILVKNWFMWY